MCENVRVWLRDFSASGAPSEQEAERLCCRGLFSAFQVSILLCVYDNNVHFFTPRVCVYPSLLVFVGVCAEAECPGEQRWHCTRSLNLVSVCGWGGEGGGGDGGEVPTSTPCRAVFDAMSLTDKHKVKRQRLDRICEGKETSSLSLFTLFEIILGKLFNKLLF